MQKSVFAAALVAVLGLASGCAFERRMDISSDPAGADLYVNGELIGHTPITAKFLFDDDREHVNVTAKMPGYQDCNMQVTLNDPPGHVLHLVLANAGNPPVDTTNTTNTTDTSGETPPDVVCKQCGAHNPAGTLFCKSCGAAIGSKQQGSSSTGSSSSTGNSGSSTSSTGSSSSSSSTGSSSSSSSGNGFPSSTGSSSTAQYKVCKQCSAKNAPDAKVCKACGAPLK